MPRRFYHDELHGTSYSPITEGNSSQMTAVLMMGDIGVRPATAAVERFTNGRASTLQRENTNHEALSKQRGAWYDSRSPFSSHPRHKAPREIRRAETTLEESTGRSRYSREHTFGRAPKSKAAEQTQQSDIFGRDLTYCADSTAARVAAAERSNRNAVSLLLGGGDVTLKARFTCRRTTGRGPPKAKTAGQAAGRQA